MGYASGWDYDHTTHEEGYSKYKLFLSDKNKYAQYGTNQNRRSFNRYNECRKHGHLNKGDGPKYKGRGLIQLTWKDNYQSFFSSINENLDIDKPDIVASELRLSCLSAGWFWRFGSALEIKDLNSHADNDDLYAISYGINGGNRGIEHRKGNIKKIFTLIKVVENCVNIETTNLGI